MEPVQVGYITLVVLIAIIAGIVIHHKWQTKGKGFESQDDIIAHNKWIYQELQRELLNAQAHLQFLNRQLPDSIPKVGDLKKQVQEKIYFWKALLSTMNHMDATKEITHLQWARMLDMAQEIATHRIITTIDYNDLALNNAVDKDIEKLVINGHLPVDAMIHTQAGTTYLKRSQDSSQTGSAYKKTFPEVDKGWDKEAPYDPS